MASRLAALPFLAPSSGWRMSAFPPLLGDKLTSGEHAKNDANDPTYDVVARACCV